MCSHRLAVTATRHASRVTRQLGVCPGAFALSCFVLCHGEQSTTLADVVQVLVPLAGGTAGFLTLSMKQLGTCALGVFRYTPMPSDASACGCVPRFIMLHPIRNNHARGCVCAWVDTPVVLSLRPDPSSQRSCAFELDVGLKSCSFLLLVAVSCHVCPCTGQLPAFRL